MACGALAVEVRAPETGATSMSALVRLPIARCIRTLLKVMQLAAEDCLKSSSGLFH